MAASDSYTNTTLHLFSIDSPDGHSLLKLDIAVPLNDEGDWNVSSPQVIRHFRSDDGCGRHFMGCGQFNSKLYILGGYRQISESQFEFPLDVMVFDPAAPDPSSDASLKSFNVSPMNAGKIGPVMFEAGGKLYVLGTFQAFGFGGSPGRDIFEEYNPETNQWKLLEKPPIDDRTHVWGFALVLDSTTVIIQGDDDKNLHIFNPTTYVWTKLEIHRHENYFVYNPLVTKDCVYEARGQGTFTKIGPISLSPPHNGVHILPPGLSREFPIMEWGATDSNSFPKKWMSGRVANKPRMHHLGDWRFCLLKSTSFFSSDNVPDSFELFFDVYIHKIIEHGKGCLKAKCLHAAHVTVETGREWVGHITSCHLITDEMQQVISSGKFDATDPKRRKI